MSASAPSQCVLKPGIGLCDDCCQPKYPQVDVGYGCMVCLDCLNGNRVDLVAAVEMKAESRKACPHCGQAIKQIKPGDFV
jgi:hypothetical protein